MSRTAASALSEQTAIAERDCPWYR